eukprot:TRINITY_DN63960_c0_g1_i1.p1 TRINITY_DN63960_c0_g1~~TRINITY_DN63960_c0_g1_i1.p1  ORF type:complete len:333 (+),score=17.24 TRINITY_DN63960_c0_g1_i1:72-1070(+)
MNTASFYPSRGPAYSHRARDPARAHPSRRALSASPPANTDHYPYSTHSDRGVVRTPPPKAVKRTATTANEQHQVDAMSNPTPNFHKYYQHVDPTVSPDDPASYYRAMACMMKTLSKDDQDAMLSSVLGMCRVVDPQLLQTKEWMKRMENHEEEQHQQNVLTTATSTTSSHYGGSGSGSSCSSLKVVFSEDAQLHYAPLFSPSGQLGVLRPVVTSAAHVQPDDHVLFVISISTARLDHQFYAKDIESLNSDNVHVVLLRWGPKANMDPALYQSLKDKHPTKVKSVMALTHYNNSFLPNETNNHQIQQFCNQLKPPPPPSPPGFVSAMWHRLTR